MGILKTLYDRLRGSTTKLHNLEVEQIGSYGALSRDSDNGILAYPTDQDCLYANIYHICPEVQSVINKKATTIASTRVKVMQKVAVKRPPVENSNCDIAEILANPNPYMTQSQLIMQISQHKDVYGKAFVALEQARVDGKTVYYLVLLDPRNVLIVPDPDTKVASYLYRVGGQEYFYPAERVAYLSDTNLLDFWFGASKLRSLLDDVNAATYSRRFYMAQYKRGKPGSVIYTSDADISPDVLRVLKEQWQNRTPESLRNILIPTGFTPTINTSTKDDVPTPIEISALTKESVAAVYDVPYKLINPGDQSDLDGLEYLWWTTSLLYETMYIAECLTKLFKYTHPKFSVAFDYSKVTALRFKLLDQTKIHVAQIATGYRTINEVRTEDLDVLPYTGKYAELGDTPMPQWTTEQAQLAAELAATNAGMESSPSLPLPGSEGSRDQTSHGEAQMVDQTGKKSFEQLAKMIEAFMQN